MAVTIHYAEIGLKRVAADGTVYSISDTKRPIKNALNFTTEHRIFPDTANANTNNFPTIRQYLNLEAAAGFQIVQIGQSFIITQLVV